MKATVLIDNITKSELLAEWGLSVYIEYGDKNILLDTGDSNNFIENAKALGTDLTKVNFAVLSHAHYDHSNGMDGFFEVNKTADFYLRDKAVENCYDKEDGEDGTEGEYEYIGIRKGTIEKYKDRIKFVNGDFEVCPGVYLIPHKTAGLDALGKSYDMYVLEDGKFRYDSFDHEQSLVFKTEKGLVIFNSCSHGGADNIINEIKETFPGEKLNAIIGGFHLYKTPADQVAAFADRLKATGVETVVTGHCTGDEAYKILEEELGDKVQQFHSGLVIEF